MKTAIHDAVKDGPRAVLPNQLTGHEGRALEKNALRKFEEGCKNEIVLPMPGYIHSW